jgi:hypothetical protein
LSIVPKKNLKQCVDGLNIFYTEQRFAIYFTEEESRRICKCKTDVETNKTRHESFG